MHDLPKLDFCLLIPCYNNKKGLLLSLDSVVYTKGDYLIVIIDDGSTSALDESSLQDGLKSSRPIVLLKNNRNEGITYSLNKGLNWIFSHTKSRYIARLDCGDICIAERFERQVQFMDTHSRSWIIGQLVQVRGAWRWI